MRPFIPEKRLERGTYIGGHQIAAIVGLHPYQSIGEVYAKCAMGLDGKGTTDVEVMSDPSRPNVLRRGKVAEPGLISWIEDILTLQHNREIELARDVFIQDPDIPFFAGTIDACEMAEGKISHMHEVTVTSSRALDAWGRDGDPGGAATYKWVQTQWYMAIGGIPGATIWVYVSDTGELRHYPIERKPDAAFQLRDDGEDFWLTHVLPKKPPPIECEGLGAWSKANDSLDAIYGFGDGGEIPSTPEMITAAGEYIKVRDEVKALDERQKATKAQMKAALGDGTESKWDGGRIYWKRNKPREVTNIKAAMLQMAQELRPKEDPEKVVREYEQANTSKQEGPRILRVYVTAGEKKKKKESENGIHRGTDREPVETAQP